MPQSPGSSIAFWHWRKKKNNKQKTLPHLSFYLYFQMPICTENVCIGSVMVPNQHARKPDEVRTKEELLPLATDFIDQYYTSIRRQAQSATPAEWVKPQWVDLKKQQHVCGWVTVDCLQSSETLFSSCTCPAHRYGSKAHVDRLEEVTKEIEASGTYQLKDTELIYGAKHAWRNAARCVGRIQWSKLQVINRMP